MDKSRGGAATATWIFRGERIRRYSGTQIYAEPAAPKRVVRHRDRVAHRLSGFAAVACTFAATAMGLHKMGKRPQAYALAPLWAAMWLPHLCDVAADAVKFVKGSKRSYD